MLVDAIGCVWLATQRIWLDAGRVQRCTAAPNVHLKLVCGVQKSGTSVVAWPVGGVITLSGRSETLGRVGSWWGLCHVSVLLYDAL